MNKKIMVGVGAIIGGMVGILMVLNDPDTARLVRADPPVVITFAFFVLALAGLGAFLGTLIGGILESLLSKQRPLG